jgi:hypothetical protein
MNKKTKKQPVQSLDNLSEEVINDVKELYQFTSNSCSDPGRLVVNRQKLFEILQAHWNRPLTKKVINQLVVLASRKLVRQPMTVNSTGSRYKYLLAETNPGHRFPVCLEVLNYLWDKPELYEVALVNYRVAAKTGREFTPNNQ